MSNDVFRSVLNNLLVKKKMLNLKTQNHNFLNCLNTLMHHTLIQTMNSDHKNFGIVSNYRQLNL